jgi:hypothetical protein
MPNIAPPCDTCKHPFSIHENDRCRVTNCTCDEFMDPPDEPEKAVADAKRLVIEIPEGFAVTVQLVPLEPS